MKKRAQQNVHISTIISMIIVVLVIVVVVISAYKWGLIDYLKNLPEFNQTEEGKKILDEQENIPDEEKDPFLGKEYPTVRLEISRFGAFIGGASFRWNRNLDKIQVLFSGEGWLINPNLNDMFLNGRGINAAEKSQIEYIMRATDEDNMIKRIAEVSKNENFYLILGNERFEEMSAEQIKQKLISLYPEFYKEEIKEEIEKGGEIFSDEFPIYFNDWGYDTLFIIKWNFVKQRAEILLRPDEDSILENGQEVWITNPADIQLFLKRHNKEADVYNTQDRPDLKRIQDIMDSKTPSEFSNKIKEILDLEEAYTTFKAVSGPAVKNQELNLIDINRRLFGFSIADPEELDKKLNEMYVFEGRYNEKNE